MITSPSGTTTQWVNWAGNVTATPSLVLEPRSVDEVDTAIRGAAERGERVRVVGAGHSFTPLVATDGVLLRLTHLSGLVAVDHATGRVRVQGGTPLHVLNPMLDGLGLALPNLGDIDRQSIAGAVSTGTHGTGTRRQGIAAAVTGLTLVLADGSVVSVDDSSDRDLFRAATVGLGAMGVVVEVELQCVPAFRLRALETPGHLDEVLEGYETMVDEFDHVDFHWFPHTDRVLLKRNSRVDAADTGRPQPRWREWLDEELLSNKLYGALNRATAARPAIVPRLNQVSSTR